MVLEFRVFGRLFISEPETDEHLTFVSMVIGRLLTRPISDIYRIVALDGSLAPILFAPLVKSLAKIVTTAWSPGRIKAPNTSLCSAAQCPSWVNITTDWRRN